MKDYSLHYFKYHNNWLTSKTEGFQIKSISYSQLRRGELTKCGQRLIRYANLKIGESKGIVEKRKLNIKNAVITFLEEVEPLKLRQIFINVQNSIRRIFSLETNRYDIKTLHRVNSKAQSLLAAERRRAMSWNSLIEIASPIKLSSRGFGILKFKDNIITKDTQLQKDDILEIQVYGRNFVVSFVKYMKSKWTLK